MQKIDFRALCEGLLQEKQPVEEKVKDHSQHKQDDTELHRLLENLLRKDTPIETKEADSFHLLACSLYVFMRKIIMEHFGMGYDYACVDRAGKPMKSWFTVPEAIETAKSLGYELTVTECRTYLDFLIRQRYIETDNYKYRRCALWCEQMERCLQRYI